MAYGAILLAALAAASAAQAAPLTYDAALKLADQTAPSVQARIADVRAARSSPSPQAACLTRNSRSGWKGFRYQDPTPAIPNGTTSATCVSG